MRVKAYITGEVDFADREQMIKQLLEKGTDVSETSHELCIHFENHDLLIRILLEDLGVNVNKIAPEKGDDSRSDA